MAGIGGSGSFPQRSATPGPGPGTSEAAQRNRDSGSSSPTSLAPRVIREQSWDQAEAANKANEWKNQQNKIYDRKETTVPGSGLATSARNAASPLSAKGKSSGSASFSLKISDPAAGPFRARPSSALEGSSRMTWGTHPAADTPKPFRHPQEQPGVKAPPSNIDQRSLPEDLRHLEKMLPRPTPLSSHKDVPAHRIEKASVWNDHNKKKGRKLAESHGGRVPNGGWPKIIGKPEEKQAQSIREIDKVLRHPETQFSWGKDWRFGVVGRYRAPEEHQQGKLNIVNTGRGAVYNEHGILHLLSNDRPEPVLLSQQDKYNAKIAKNKAKKEG